jgi:type I restriction enzyme S subunit
MKDSGVEWLGEVPEHWEIIEARREIVFLTSGSRGWAEFYSETGPLFLRIGNLTRNSLDIDLSDAQRVDPPLGSEGARTEVQQGDVLFSITAYLGSVAVVPSNLEAAYVSQHVCLARLAQKRMLPKWLGYAVMSSSGKAYLEAESYGGTKVQLSLDDIKSFPVAVPPINEQQDLVTYIEEALFRVERLAIDSEKNIALLQERRSALISAAVTGQIDVRGLVPEAVAA